MISLSTPNICGNEWKYIQECLDTSWVSSAGKYVDLFEQKVAEYTGAAHAVACINGTSALHISLKLAGVKPKEEVILPTLTFIAPVNAVSYNGGSPIFMDVDEHYNLDIRKTIEFIQKHTIYKNGITFNKKTKKPISAIVPIHMWGNAVWLDELMPLLKERNITVVEDASESMGTFYVKGNYNECHTGTLGKFGCLSFNGNKIITAGGGGMIMTNCKKMADMARYLTTQAKDDPIRYYHNRIGYNYRLTNIQAALGVAQLEQLPHFIERKYEIYKKYKTALNNVDGLSVADVPYYAENNHWMVMLQIDKEKYGHDSESIMRHLDKTGIQTRPAWAPIHMQKPYKKCESYHIEKALELVGNSLCLPSSTNLTNSEIDYVIETLVGDSKSGAGIAKG